MRRWFLVTLGLLGIFSTLPGCGPAVSRSDLGEVRYEVPEVPGADKEYKIPDVGPPVTPQAKK
jgi:hypothetical protein